MRLLTRLSTVPNGSTGSVSSLGRPYWGQSSPSSEGGERSSKTDKAALSPEAAASFIDYAHEMAPIVLRTNSAGKLEIVGIGRLIMEHERNEAEFALAISDSVQGNGLDTEVLRLLIEIGHRERVGRIVGYILAKNRRMLDVCHRLGFRFEHEIGDPLVTAIQDLT